MDLDSSNSFNINTLHIVQFAIDQNTCAIIYKLLKPYESEDEKAKRLSKELEPCILDKDGGEMTSNVGIIAREKLMNAGWEQLTPNYSRFVRWCLSSDEHIVKIISVSNYLVKRRKRLAEEKADT